MTRRTAKKILERASASFCNGHAYAPPIHLITRAARVLPTHYAAILGAPHAR